MQSGAENWLYVYTPDDERIWSIKVGANNDTWSIRDLDQKVLRDYTRFKSDWTATRDYLYRGSQLLGAITPKAPRYYHLDHLGTPRLTTSIIPNPLGYHVYYPYGEEATDPNQGDSDRMKFTGHERDLGSAAGTGDDLDYMHARFCSPVTGRFMGVDPALDVEKVRKNPQKWNRYSYVLNNPQKYIDENGMEENLVGGGIVVNKSSQDVYIAFDADRLNSDGSNLDVVIPLHPGENSEKYTFDADAVVIGEGQTIGGATKGSFKVSAGSVVVKDGKDGKLDLFGSATYFAMKNRKNPEQRAGYQSEEKTPQQWKVSRDHQRAERLRQKTAATKSQRYWNKVKSTLQLSRP